MNIFHYSQAAPPSHYHILGVITQIVIDHLMSPLCCGLQHSLQIMTPWDDDDGGDEDDNLYHDDDVFLILNKVYTEKGFRLVAWHMILWWASVGKTCRKNIWNNILHFQSTSISSLRCLSFNNYRAIPWIFQYLVSLSNFVNTNLPSWPLKTTTML